MKRTYTVEIQYGDGLFWESDQDTQTITDAISLAVAEFQKVDRTMGMGRTVRNITDIIARER